MLSLNEEIAEVKHLPVSKERFDESLKTKKQKAS